MLEAGDAAGWLSHALAQGLGLVGALGILVAAAVAARRPPRFRWGRAPAVAKAGGIAIALSPQPATADAPGSAASAPTVLAGEAAVVDARRQLAVAAHERQRAEAELRRSVDELEFILRTREELERSLAERSLALEAVNAELAREVGERTRAEAELRTALTRVEGLIGNTPLGVVECWRPPGDAGWLIDRWTGQAEAMFGWSRAEAVGRPVRALHLTGVGLPDLESTLGPALANGETGHVRVTLTNRTKAGQPLVCTWYHSILPDGQGTRVLSLVEDVTERTAVLERAQWLAQHDPLTGLPNRTLFDDRLRQALAMARRQNLRVAVLMLDLDRFKRVNDDFGHQTGDALLQQVAQRLRGCIRESDTLGRLGGDEFAVMQTALVGTDGALRLAERLVQAIGAPFDVQGHKLGVALSVGLALYPEHGSAPEGLFAAADQALYRSKARGGSCTTLAEPIGSAPAPR